MENFKRPYFSTSIKEFWSRWHISLSTWFRDYVYIPLGGSKQGSLRTYVNVLIVFLISGLWHGASWMFVIWGAIHGLYQLYEKASFSIRARLWNFIGLEGTWIQWSIKWVVTMTVVLTSWVFFRAGSLNEVLSIFSSFSKDLNSGIIFSDFISLLQMNQIGLGVGAFRLIIIIISVLVMEIYQILKESHPETINNIMSDRYVRFIVSQALILWILLFGQFGLQAFIYFQF
jgi:alginate O-acetyltransferase complex protein AlgI